MAHEGRYSFESSNEQPAHNRRWNEIDRNRSISHPLRPVSENVSPISSYFDSQPPLHLEPNPLGSNVYHQQGSRVERVQEEPTLPFQEVRRAVEDVPARPSPSFLEVRHAVELPIPDLAELPATPFSAVVRRKPVPESPRARSVPYNPRDLMPEPPLPPLPKEALAWGNSVEILSGHPQNQQIQEKPRSFLWSMILTNIFFLIIPLLFFGLTICLGIQDNRSTENRRHWEAFQNLMKVAGTFFPIAFAALTGRAALKIAGYRLEHGVKLGPLEQLMGSRTFGNTLGTLAQLRSFNVLSLGFLALWIMSPIGSQAVLRILSTKIASSTTPISVPYFNTDEQSMFAESATNSGTAQPQSIATITSMYVAAVLGPSDTKNGTMDLWGNVKIPYQSSLEPTAGSWYSPNNNAVYSSLTGLPVSSVQIGQTDFTMESSYMELSCGTLVQMSAFLEVQPFEHGPSPNHITHSPSNGTYRGSNTSSSTTATWSLGLDTFVSPELNNSLAVNSSSKSCQPGDDSYTASPCYLRGLSNSQSAVGTLLFQSLDVPYDPSSASQAVQAAFCQVQQVYVESNITCSQPLNGRRDCYVVAQRNSESLHAPSTITPLSFPEIFDAVSLGLPRSFGVPDSGTKSDPSVFYLNDTSTQAIVTADGPANLLNLPADVLAQRLGQLINTYYSLSQTNTIMAQGSTSSFPENITTTGTITTTSEVYSVSWPWFAFLFIATMLMLLAAITSLICERLTLNPEILGYTSSIIRDSRYVQIPAKEGLLDGLQLTKNYQYLALKMGAVEENGHLHLAVLKEEDAIQTGSDGGYV